MIAAVPEDVLARVRGASPRCGSSVVIGIDGPSGAGKTEFARRLAAQTDAALVQLDDVYPGWDGLAEAPPRVAAALADVAEERPGRYQGWDWARSRPAGTRTIEPAPLIVVEGVGAGSAPIRRYLSLLVWIDGPVDVRRARALARDGDTYAPHWDRWAAQEARLFAADDVARHADVILDTAPDPGGRPPTGSAA